MTDQVTQNSNLEIIKNTAHALPQVALTPRLEPIPVPDYEKKSLPITDVWQRIRSGSALDLSIDHPSIAVHRNWYANNQKYLNRVSKRAQRYMYHVVEAIEARQMPLEIALLPIVESAFDPFAFSHGRAAGMWQFIPGTGRRFNLTQDWWYDGRRDVVASTEAALDYLSLLHQRFDGDWLLALAAYNAGGGNVSKAIKRNQAKNKPIDFFSLELPKETEAYVPRLIALAQLLAAPERFNVDFKPIANRPYFAQVEIGSQIDLAQAAELAQVSLNEIYLLNPGFNQWATSPDGPHRLNVPVRQESVFRENLSALPAEKRISWVRYSIKNGDTLSTIAQRHGTTTKALKQINQLDNNRIRAGKVLFIPVASKGAEAYALSAPNRFTAKQQQPEKQGKTKQVHQVKAGDSLWEISRAYQVGMRDIARWNSIGTTTPLRIGQKLVIWQQPAADEKLAQSKALVADRSIIRQVGYSVKKGDSLARIAQKFNVSVANIERWNGLDRKKHLQPGQSLKLFVDVTRASL